MHISRAPERPAPSGPSASPTPSPARSTVPLGDFGPGDEAKRRDLRKMKMLATGFFVVATIVFLVAKYLEDVQGLGWAGYVRASAEAGMVGALADWFAVTALFRHPLRIPIPHTAIIPRKKDMIGDSLGDFVGENFLSEAVVRDKLDRVGISSRVGTWIAQTENADRVTAELTAAARGIVTVLRDEDVQNVLETVVVRKLLEVPVGPPLGKALEGVLADGAHKRLVDLVCDRAYDWVADNEEMVMRVVHERAPSWTPRFVDEMVADKLFAEVRGFAWNVKNDPEHPLRHAVDRYLSEFATDLQSDPATIERAEQVKRQVVEHPEVQHFIGRAWTVVKSMVLDAAEDPTNELRLRVRDALVGLGRRIEGDDELRGKIDGWVADAAGYVVRHYRHEITTLITETVARWDAEETSKKIELQVGRDLQWIRINGTVVGALAGLVIYTVSELII
ncbi:uncharacterized membrane-anchored protein YjiN (DUF445 family) [Pseudonocardia sediminis]|uniref:Uncharacterized membrane-anchored protein YjiN (DUF445 family) n=1 Tax=Pseudonocardia sediminis TaxID=1397368 RepID=A0A4Q7UPU1_PSEST|nr:uncharacterized membrane-anchored protein YjiN (DUF445 family) [Pseudonocardia sediminis]